MEQKECILPKSAEEIYHSGRNKFSNNESQYKESSIKFISISKDVVIEDQTFEKSSIYKFAIKTEKKFFSNTVTRATLCILNEENERIEFFLTNEKHLKKVI